MILFFHGLNSSNNTNKFATIDRKKYCETVDYLELGYDAVNNLYDELIDRIKPDVLVGHSLGGYWALKKSAERNIPCVLLNPSLFPKYDGYTALSEQELQRAPAVHAYIELGDKVIPAVLINEFLKARAHVKTHYAGHHRIEYVENINKIIERHYAYEYIH